MRKLMVAFCFLIAILMSPPVHAQKWWEKWDNFPKVPRITAKEVKNLMLAGEKIAFVYAGYEVDQVVCGSYYIPYTRVPPHSDGSTVNFRIPKDYWIMCY